MDTPKWLHYRETPSHGYYSVDAAHFAQMKRDHPELLTRTDFYSGNNSFEEDCEVYRITLAFPAEFDAKLNAAALSWLINYQPEIYERYTKHTPTVNDSHLVAEREFFKMTKCFYVAISASGSWHATVPEGFVGLCLVLGGRNPDTYRYASRSEIRKLVPSAEYNTKRELPFYIDNPDDYADWPEG